MTAFSAPLIRGRLVVDIRAVLSMVGRIITFLSFALLAPIAIAMVDGETIRPFAIAFAAGVIGGQALELGCGRRSALVTVREAFAVVALT